MTKEQVSLMFSTPLWVPLIVAFIGVLATLSATVFTQIWSARREDVRWKRERDAEERRWQQAQEERTVQWQRDERQRWLTERKEVYAKFLLALDSWNSAIAKARGELRQSDILGKEVMSILADNESTVTIIYETFRLIAPTSIMELAHTVYISYGITAFNVQRGNAPEPREFESLLHVESELRTAIRSDLGVE